MTSPILTAAAVRRVTASGTNLFALAAQYLGDASQWTRIARANGLVDPWVDTGSDPDGIVELTIPPRSATAGTGGILE